jgi:hypothetical protein
VGRTWLVQISLVDAEAGTSPARATRKSRDLDDLVDAVESATKEILRAVPASETAAAKPTGGKSAGAEAPGEAGASPGASPANVPPSLAPPKAGAASRASGRTVLFWSGLGASAVALGAGGILWWQAEDRLHTQTSLAQAVVERGAPSDDLLTPDAYEATKRRRTLGISLAAGGLALAGADLLYLALTRQPTGGATLIVVPGPGGALASVTWRLP